MEKYYLDLVTQKPVCIKGKSATDIAAKVDLTTMKEINIDEYQELNLVLLKKEKLNAINKQAQQFIDEVANIDSTPNFERETWQEQETEAKAWKKNNQASTPVLELIARTRGVDLNQLREKAYQKALAYRQISAVTAGQRQRYEDMLNAAQTESEVKAIVPIFIMGEVKNEQN